MNISVINQSDCHILILEGRLDSVGAQTLEQLAVSEGGGWDCCILDFQGVAFLSSLGIRVLIKMDRAMKSRQGRLLLAAISEDVRWTLETTGLIPAFTICANRDEALALMSISSEKAAEFAVAQCHLTHYTLHDKALEMLLWSSETEPGAEDNQLEELAVSLDELVWSVGRGRLNSGSREADPRYGCFLAYGNALLINGAENDSEPELVLSRQPADLHLGIQRAVSWGGSPNHLLQFNNPPVIQAGAVNEILLQALQEATQQKANVAGWLVLAAQADDCENSVPDLLLAGWGRLDSLATYEGLERMQLISGTPPSSFQGIAIRLKHGWEAASEASWQELGKVLKQMDRVAALQPLDPELSIRPIKAWCFLPETIGSGPEKRMVIEIIGGQPLPPAWETIARRIYAGARKVTLDPLTGGYSPAQPYRATAEDMHGRRMLPTVFKVGPEELVEREQEAHHKYVEKYILNNSTTIIGSHSYQGACGICYNFLGIGGPDSRLDWMGKVYREKDAGAVIGLLDRLFTSVLKPWYGQPQWKELYLYRDHVTAFSFFPSLFADAERVSGISADQADMDCPWLGRRVPNPFYFLKQEYPVRQQQAFLWYEGICHGDLNLQNILLDEKENLYVIDFSETGPRNIMADFARLEPIIKFETTRLENEQDLAALIKLEEGLATVSSLDEKPPLVYEGSDPAVFKAYQVLLRLRQYARQVIIFENDIIPYLLAVLEWTYPVVSYRSSSTLGKSLALFSAALMVEQIMRIEAERRV